LSRLTTRYESRRFLSDSIEAGSYHANSSLKKNIFISGIIKENTIEDIFSKDQLKDAYHLKAIHFESAVWLNNGNGTFSKRDLPVQAQFAPVYAMLVEDFTADGVLDIFNGWQPVAG
jgi:hypothetical protein